MDTSHSSELRVATAEGPGSGRFLARALLDALDAGSDLARISIQFLATPRGAWAVDFTFGHLGPGAHEVIRAGLDAEGRVVAAELFRSSRHVPAWRHREAAGLAAALREGEEIVALRLQAGPAAGEPRAVIFRLGDPPKTEFALDVRAFAPATRTA